MQLHFVAFVNELIHKFINRKCLNQNGKRNFKNFKQGVGLLVCDMMQLVYSVTDYYSVCGMVPLWYSSVRYNHCDISCLDLMARAIVIVSYGWTTQRDSYVLLAFIKRLIYVQSVGILIVHKIGTISSELTIKS